LHGLASGTNWVFRDESCHLEFAFEVVNVVRAQEPDLWDAELEKEIVTMMQEAVDAEAQFSEDLLSGGVAGLSVKDMRAYLGHVADSRLERMGIAPAFHTKNPFGFMELQDVQELTNFFERRVSAYQTAVPGEVEFTDDF
jgi:ribonucleoside-diphosphate reductase beta chain